MMSRRSPMRLFVIYLVTFFAALTLAWIVFLQVAPQVREGSHFLLLLPPLGGMALFHGVFPLVSRLRLGLEFVAVGGGLVYGLGAVIAGLALIGLLDPGTAIVFWLVGVFGPGWWLMSRWAEQVGYFK